MNKPKFIEDMTTKELEQTVATLDRRNPDNELTATVLQNEIQRREYGDLTDLD